MPGLFLIMSGLAVFSVCSLILRYRAFKESAAWGMACLLLPLATLFFSLRFWQKTKGIFYAQLAGFLLFLAGAGVMLRDPETRAGLISAFDYRSQIRELDEVLDSFDGPPRHPRSPRESQSPGIRFP